MILMGLTVSYIVTACWLIFIAYWVVAAVRVKQTVERESIGSAIRQRIPLTIGWLLMVYRKFPSPLNYQLIPETDAVLITGTVVAVAGLLVAIWARHTLADNWSANVTFKQGHELIRTGPYRLVRHPIYTGILLMWLGTVINIGELRGFISLLLAIFAFWIKLLQEERLMLQHFPDQYPAYRQQVKALVPFVV